MQSEMTENTYVHKEGRILIVDDDADFALSLLDVLESRGYQVAIAHDVSGGREQAQRLDAQVALVDIRLRHDSGINLIAQLKAVNPKIVCVMMTAYAAIDNAIEAIHQGAYDYLQKPLDLRYLLVTLNRCFEKLQLEKDKAQAEMLMRQSAKMASVGRLAAGIAHEINNPLSAMMQSAQMLQIACDTQRPSTCERLQACGIDPDGLERYLKERDIHEYLEGIRSAGERAATIVSNLLSFSYKSSQTSLYDLNVLVERALGLAATDYNLKEKYDFREIQIVRDLTPDLPQVLCDSQQIQQVVLNLVHNAARGMEEKKMAVQGSNDRAYHPRLTLRTALVKDARAGENPLDPSGHMVRLEVEDNGPGLPEATQAQLFEPFFTTRGEGEGTGLGLWLAWSIIVEQHQGRIWGEPGPEEGARFVIELPVDDTP
jgi:signal transduction histidine kinase